MEERNNLAFLSNSGSYSIFQFQEDVIRFMTSPRLEKYQKVLEWDAGCLFLRKCTVVPEERIPLFRSKYTVRPEQDTACIILASASLLA